MSGKILKGKSGAKSRQQVTAKEMLLLKRRMDKAVKDLREKMKKDLQKERERQRRELQYAMVSFPTHTKNVYHSTFIQPSVFLMSSDSLPKFTSL